MRYSEAIRLGGMLAPKCQGKFYREETGAMCVQGAALNAIGCLNKYSPWLNHREMENHFPFADETLVGEEDWPPGVSHLAAVCAHRECSFFGPESIKGVSIILNNHTDWTREQIADWVAKMEDKYGYEEDPPTNTQQIGRNTEIATMRRA